MKKLVKKMLLAKETLRSLENENQQLDGMAGATRADTECFPYNRLCNNTGDSKYC